MDRHIAGTELSHRGSALLRRVPRAAVLAAGLVLGCLGTTTDPRVAAIGGLYVLEQIDGQSRPVPPPAPGTADPCPPAVTDGELSLGTPGSERVELFYTALVNASRACDPNGIPVDASAVLKDGGTWSIAGDRLTFTSSPYNRRGVYYGTVQQVSPVPRVAVEYGGRVYTFRRLDPGRDLSSYASVAVVDQQGTPVAGALVVFRFSNGQVLRVYSGSGAMPLLAGASPGTLTVAVAPPSGYTFAPSQSNPVTTTVQPGQQVQLTVVLTKTTP